MDILKLWFLFKTICSVLHIYVSLKMSLKVFKIVLIEQLQRRNRLSIGKIGIIIKFHTTAALRILQFAKFVFYAILIITIRSKIWSITTHSVLIGNVWYYSYFKNYKTFLICTICNLVSLKLFFIFSANDRL